MIHGTSKRASRVLSSSSASKDDVAPTLPDTNPSTSPTASNSSTILAASHASAHGMNGSVATDATPSKLSASLDDSIPLQPQPPSSLLRPPRDSHHDHSDSTLTDRDRRYYYEHRHRHRRSHSRYQPSRYFHSSYDGDARRTAPLRSHSRSRSRSPMPPPRTPSRQRREDTGHEERRYERSREYEYQRERYRQHYSSADDSTDESSSPRYTRRRSDHARRHSYGRSDHDSASSYDRPYDGPDHRSYFVGDSDVRSPPPDRRHARRSSRPRRYSRSVSRSRSHSRSRTPSSDSYRTHRRSRSRPPPPPTREPVSNEDEDESRPLPPPVELMAQLMKSLDVHGRSATESTSTLLQIAQLATAAALEGVDHTNNSSPIHSNGPSVHFAPHPNDSHNVSPRMSIHRPSRLSMTDQDSLSPSVNSREIVPIRDDPPSDVHHPSSSSSSSAAGVARSSVGSGISRRAQRDARLRESAMAWEHQHQQQSQPYAQSHPSTQHYRAVSEQDAWLARQMAERTHATRSMNGSGIMQPPTHSPPLSPQPPLSAPLTHMQPHVHPQHHRTLSRPTLAVPYHVNSWSSPQQPPLSAPSSFHSPPQHHRAFGVDPRLVSPTSPSPNTFFAHSPSAISSQPNHFGSMMTPPPLTPPPQVPMIGANFGAYNVRSGVVMNGNGVPSSVGAPSSTFSPHAPAPPPPMSPHAPHVHALAIAAANAAYNHVARHYRSPTPPTQTATSNGSITNPTNPPNGNGNPANVTASASHTPQTHATNQPTYMHAQALLQQQQQQQQQHAPYHSSHPPSTLRSPMTPNMNPYLTQLYSR